MAKTVDHLLTVINEASSRCACTADELDYIHALLASIAAQSQEGSVIHGLATLGSRLAEAEALHMHITRDDLTAEVNHG